MQSWSIVIFSYNEQGNVSKVIQQLLEVLPKMTETWEIIVVDDGSTDQSVAEITPFLNERIQLIRHVHNKGIGHTLLDGYHKAQYENVCAVPGDGEFDVSELLPYARFEAGTMLSFYRVVKTSYSSYRDILSMCNRKLNEWILGVKLKDVNWINVYKNADLRSFENQLTSSLVETENCYKLQKKGIKIVEVASNYREREHGRSKGGSIKVVWQACLDMINIYRSH